MQSDLERILFDEPTIQRRLDTIAAQISNDYRNRDLTVIAILNGSLIFMADLLRRVPLPLRLDCLGVASYHGKAQTSGDVIFKQVAMPDVAGRHILLLDDILDSGHTLAAIRGKLAKAIHAASEFAFCLAKRRNAYGTLMPITSGSKLKTSSWLVMDSISRNSIAIFHTSGCCERN